MIVNTPELGVHSISKSLIRPLEELFPDGIVALPASVQLHGRIVAEDGAPLAGVRLELPDLRAFSSSGPEVVPSHDGWWTLSDAAGRFNLSVSTSCRWLHEFRANYGAGTIRLLPPEELEPGELPWQQRPGEPLDIDGEGRHLFVLASQETYALRVLDPDGLPIEGAIARYTDSPVGREQLWTGTSGPDGRMRLLHPAFPAILADLHVSARGYRAQLFSNREPEALGAIVLQPAPALRVRVIEPDRSPLPFARLTLLQQPAGRRADRLHETPFGEAMPGTRMVLTDAAGQAELHDVLAGPFTLQASISGRYRVRLSYDEVPSEPIEVCSGRLHA